MHQAQKALLFIAKSLSTSALFVATLAANAGPSGPDIADCNRTEHQWVFSPAAKDAPLEARAYWLNRQQVQWPGETEVGIYKLYHAPLAAMAVLPGQPVRGAGGFLVMQEATGPLAPALAKRFQFIAPGIRLQVALQDLARMPALLREQMVLVREDAQGLVQAATLIQTPGALDDWYAAAQKVNELGVTVSDKQTRFKLWAPTARSVALCVYAGGASDAQALLPMARHARTGMWVARHPAKLEGAYYTYLVDVVVPGVGMVRNKVTDPYSLSLTTDSTRSFIADLNSASLKPKGWDLQRAPRRVRNQTDMVVYELHVRDFSINDASVPPQHRGKYTAFTLPGSRGMQHLQTLSRAGLTDVHLLPVFDIATIPEQGCMTPQVPPGLGADSEEQQAIVMAQAANDCFNWGYDPFHFNAPEGSFASNPADGAVRVREFRQMVMGLHAAGLRVGMDVVYNHTTASGQHAKSVLDRIVPGYYQRLNALGQVERSTCCENTATEHAMMGKLMVESAVLWATQYKIDSFRFDLMAHQPRSVMEELQSKVNQATGRRIQLLGEGWNFGEVANGARFVQASQLSLGGSGIGTFSDRGRDAARGGGAGESGTAIVKNQGYLNGQHYDRNALAEPSTAQQLMRTADMIRVGLAGSLRAYEMTDSHGRRVRLEDLKYGDQPAGYVGEPGEVVNYVENHDNHTLFDINAFKLPASTSAQDRARVQILGAALPMFSQGVAYFHAGMETLRSKSMDGNSYDSGDWFNRLDWSLQDNYFATGMPPRRDNLASYPWIKPALANAAMKPTPADIAWTSRAFADLLEIRASSTLFRMARSADIRKRLTFMNTGPSQNPVVIAAHLDGKGYPGARFGELMYFVNVSSQPQRLVLEPHRGKDFVLHPVHLQAKAADERISAQAAFEPATGTVVLPARAAVVFVMR